MRVSGEYGDNPTIADICLFGHLTSAKMLYDCDLDLYIAYYRVSTDRQRRSGLGIEAERTAVHRFAEAEGLKIASEYVETETGKDADALDRRPQLAAGLAAEGMSAGPFLGVPGGDSS